MNIIGEAFNFVISKPLGYIIYWCFYITKNYGIAILLFTLITRILLFPLAIKQQKATAEMVRLQPKLQAIQKKYGKDKQKLQEEQMKLYQEEGYNPFGGCLPMLIQLPILWGLYNVIYKPYTYMLNISNSTLKKAITALWNPLLSFAKGALGKNPTVSSVLGNSRSEIYIAHAVKGNEALVSNILPHSAISMNFNFLSLDLTYTPGYAVSRYLLIPIVCYLTSLLSSWLTMKITQPSNMQNSGAQNAAGMNKSMLIIMPLVSAFFAFQVPAGMGFYWICMNVIMILQALVLNKFYNPKRLAEAAEEQSARRKEERRRKNGVTAAAQEEQAPEKEETTQLSEKTVEQPHKQPKPVSSDGKKTKKQLMEENRKRLAESRAKEQGK